MLHYQTQKFNRCFMPNRSSGHSGDAVAERNTFAYACHAGAGFRVFPCILGPSRVSCQASRTQPVSRRSWRQVSLIVTTGRFRHMLLSARRLMPTRPSSKAIIIELNAGFRKSKQDRSRVLCPQRAPTAFRGEGPDFSPKGFPGLTGIAILPLPRDRGNPVGLSKKRAAAERWVSTTYQARETVSGSWKSTRLHITS